MTQNDPLNHHEFLLPKNLLPVLCNLCVQSIKCSDNHPTVIKAVKQLAASLRSHSRKSIGADSVEVVSLNILLENVVRSKVHNPKRDKDVLRLFKTKQLSEDRLEAAEEIRRVWFAFGRILGVVTSRYSSKLSKSKKRRNQPTPLDVLSDNEFSIWENRYRPWYNNASKKLAGKVSHAQLVLDCLLYDIIPEHIDKRENLRKGTTRKILLEELDIYIYGPKRE